MKTLVPILVVLALVGVELSGDDDPAPPTLSEVQTLKAANFQLRVQVAQLRATLADRENRLAALELSAEHAALVEDFRKTLQAEPAAVFDWQTLQFRTGDPP